MLSSSTIELIPVLEDNYVIAWHDGREAVLVDPAVAAPVIDWLDQRRLQPLAVLQTHHHADHIGGTPELLRRWPDLQVVAARADRERIPFQTRGVAEGEQLSLLGRRLTVLEVPGHTRAHVAFHLQGEPERGLGDELFCGDTLFLGGCGRLFEGTAAQMHHSLQRLAGLPENTRVWCAHEDTETNLRWAHAQLPQDAAIAARLERVAQQRRAGRITLPGCIAEERRTNLFLRAVDAEALSQLRESRNHWRS
ncbi:MAG: hydroxyacylglutathione hydrolase [Synechococcaceae cyanobacterium]|nr:hydroxyacylglutathione hydrolase [Synechococcaceae cyanobacterium]